MDKKTYFDDFAGCPHEEIRAVEKLDDHGVCQGCGWIMPLPDKKAVV